MVELFLLVRAAHLAATALAAGTAAFIVLVAQPSLRDAKDIASAELAVLRRQWRWLIWISLAVAIVSGAGWLVLLAADILGQSIFQVCLHGGVVSVLLETRFGIVWAVRLILALLMAVLLLRPGLRLPLLIAAVGLIGSLAFVGHAGATPGTSGEVHLASDILHLLATGAWIGGLPALALFLERTRHLPEQSLGHACGRSRPPFFHTGHCGRWHLARHRPSQLLVPAKWTKRSHRHGLWTSCPAQNNFVRYHGRHCCG